MADYIVQQAEQLNLVNDIYGGVIVNVEQPMDSKVYSTLLRASMSQWRQQKKMTILHMQFKFTLALVLVLTCGLLATEARKMLYEEHEDIINKDHLFGSVEQGEAASPYLPNPTNPATGTGADIATSMISEKVFVTDPFLPRRQLLKTPIPPSGPHTPTWIPGPPRH